MIFNFGSHLPVLSDWNGLSGCRFAEKKYVDPNDPEYGVLVSKEGYIVRVWCNHTDNWCSAQLGYMFCTTYMDHKND